jgi:hypothetical protein
MTRLDATKQDNFLIRKNMKTATVKFKSLSPISFGRFHGTEKLDKEGYDEYETRTWRNKVHSDKDGNVVITPFMIKNMISDVAKFLSVKIKGKGQQTYTKHFEAGIIVYENMPIGIKKENVDGQWMHVPSDGKRGGSKRVMKCFPVIQEWEGTIDIQIVDETITQDVLLEHLTEAGKFIGLGSLRPRNNGIFGRFEVEILSFS